MRHAVKIKKKELGNIQTRFVLYKALQGEYKPIIHWAAGEI